MKLTQFYSAKILNFTPNDKKNYFSETPKNTVFNNFRFDIFFSILIDVQINHFLIQAFEYIKNCLIMQLYEEVNGENGI